MQRHRHQEFIRFLNAVEAETPVGKIVHVVLDNYATHKHPKVKAWLGRHPRLDARPAATAPCQHEAQRRYRLFERAGCGRAWAAHPSVLGCRRLRHPGRGHPRWRPTRITDFRYS
jgi:hypothetical protein